MELFEILLEEPRRHQQRGVEDMPLDARAGGGILNSQQEDSFPLLKATSDAVQRPPRASHIRMGFFQPELKLEDMGASQVVSSLSPSLSCPLHPSWRS